MQALADEELVSATISGRTAAYEELVRRWTPRVLALCHAKVGRYGVAEDMAQEALLRGFRAIGSLSDPAKFGPWLTGIVRHTCLDWLKAKERAVVNFGSLGQRGNPDEFLPSCASATEPELDRVDELQHLVAEVESLPEEYREVVMLYYYQDLKYRDIAGLLGVSMPTVNARLTKARALLRKRLDSSRRSP